MVNTNTNGTAVLNYTVFFTYMLSNTGNTKSYGYSDAIHCNYINNIQLNDVINREVNLYFNDINDFKFLSTGSTDGTGYTANKIYIIAQLINNLAVTEIKPISTDWKIFDVTDQIRYRISGSTTPISAIDLASSVFKVSVLDFNTAPTYNLEYLNYPLITANGLTVASFGDEEYFLGNVTSDIEAIAYTTDLGINLPLNQFNSTTNSTWDANSPVYISEVGIYDIDENLVAIGKLNNPILKDSTISRTLVFAIDF